MTEPHSERRRNRWPLLAAVVLSLAVVALSVFVYVSETRPGPVSSTDRARAAARVAETARGKAVRTSCTATTAIAVCLVTVYVPEPLDACQDWSVDVDFAHHVGPLRWLGTRN